MSGVVTVAIPVLDGGAVLEQTLAAVAAQRVEREVELLVADSGSRDGSPAAARRHGAAVIDIAPGTFSHGGTRNRLMDRARGDHVTFLTQDATPADDRWLARLLEGFELASDVGLVFGPYRPRPGASPSVRRELEEFFASLAGPGGAPRVEAREPGSPVTGEGVRRVPEAAAFFTDANGVVARRAWERVPFRDVPYAEDRLLGLDMLDAGFAKVFVPLAAVIHSHDYPPLAHFRRCFDEWRGLREVSGHIESTAPRSLARALRDGVRGDVALLRCEGARRASLAAGAARSARHHALRHAGATLGSRADRLPAAVRRVCSLEGRASFEPLPGTAP